MPKGLKKASKKVEAVEKEVPAVDDVPAEQVDADVVADATPAVYVDPEAFVYEVQAGKKFAGFSALEAVQFASVMIGKVDKIVISKQK